MKAGMAAPAEGITHLLLQVGRGGQSRGDVVPVVVAAAALVALLHLVGHLSRQNCNGYPTETATGPPGGLRSVTAACGPHWHINERSMVDNLGQNGGIVQWILVYALDNLESREHI